jgi:hypothetical protein
MSGDRTSKAKRAKTARPRGGLDPARLVDAAGLLGLGAFAWGVAAPRFYEVGGWAAPVREVGLLFVGCALVVRTLDWILRHRDGKSDARRDLLRRLTGLNEAILELRKSLSRDNTRGFLDRKGEFTAGLKLGAGWMTEEEARLSAACGEFCERMTKALADTVNRRGGVTALADRLRREIDRSARRGDLDPHDADNLQGLIDDSLLVMDEAIYAEWNADHFGRLTADRRAFAREIERYRSDGAVRLEHHAMELFDHLLAHVNKKIEVVDMILDWDEAYRKLEMRLAGLDPSNVTPIAEAARAQRLRVVDRFVVTPPAGAAEELPRRRLPAAND